MIAKEVVNKWNFENPDSPNYFENFCSACDYFGTRDCPYAGHVRRDTQWRKIGCTNFWD